jgi:DNA-binding NarL/FixJ family response regulator
VVQSIPATELPDQIQQLYEQRRRHINSIRQIDQILDSLIAALDATTTLPTPSMAIEKAGLTRRQRQTLRHLLLGRTEKEAAEVMQISPSTVHLYIRLIYRKFQVNSRARLMGLFLQEIAKSV